MNHKFFVISFLVVFFFLKLYEFCVTLLRANLLFITLTPTAEFIGETWKLGLSLFESVGSEDKKLLLLYIRWIIEKISHGTKTIFTFHEKAKGQC